MKNERHSAHASTAVYIENEEGRLLLLQQASKEKGYKWSPPGGGVLKYETPIMAAIRKTKEETGLDVQLLEFVGLYTIPRGEDKTSFGFTFTAKSLGGSISLDPKEILNARYFAKHEIEDLIEENMLYKPEFNIRGIQDWMNGERYPLDFVRPIQILESQR